MARADGLKPADIAIETEAPPAVVSCSQAAPAAGESENLTPVAVKATKITGKFWAPKLKIYREDTIPHSWNYINCSIQEFRNAASAEKTP